MVNWIKENKYKALVAGMLILILMTGVLFEAKAAGNVESVIIDIGNGRVAVCTIPQRGVAACAVVPVVVFRPCTFNDAVGNFTCPDENQPEAAKIGA